MKRLLSFITVLCILASCFVLHGAYASAEELVGESDFAQLRALGLMVGDENDDARLDAYMTRAEFSQLLMNLLTYKNGSDDTDTSAWANNFYGESTDHNILKYPTEDTSVQTVYFDDVPESHWAYEPITYVRKLGIVNGTSAATFNPEDNIRTNEAIKCLMVLLGYENVAQATGGYPAGYLNYAHKIKLTSGIELSEYITRGNIAAMIVNCMESSILEISSIGENVSYDYDSDRTFATEILGISKVTGLMTDNGYTSMLGVSSYDGEYIVIDDTLLEVPAEAKYHNFMGRDVECWYKNDNTNEPGTVVCMTLSGNDKALIIDSDTIAQINDKEISYVNDSNNIKREDISDGYVFYNGLALTEYTSDIFDIDYGTITIVKTNSQKYDKIILVNEFETWYVSNVNASENIIYNNLKDGKNITEDDILELDFDDPEYKISIYNADGSETAFSGISKGSVLDVLRSDNNITIYISNSRITDFVVQEIHEDDYKLTISDGEKEFALTSAYRDYYFRDEIRTGDKLTLYLNSRERVAWAVKSSDSDLSVAYLIRSGQNGGSALSSSYAVKLYDINGVITIANLAEKLTVSDSQGDESRISAEEFITKYGSYSGICRYAANDDELTYIEFPILDNDTNINGKLHLIMETDENTMETDGYYIANQINSFGGKALLNSNSKVICYNPDSSDEDKAFSTGDMGTFGDKTDNIVKLYSDLEGSPVGKYVVYETESLNSDFNMYSGQPDLYVIRKIVQGIFPDESTGYILKTTKFNLNTLADEELYLENGVMSSIETEAEDKSSGSIAHKKFDGKLEPGDIIRVSKNTDGIVTAIRIIWDENGTADGGITPGSLPGMSEYYHTADYNTNPWAASWNAGSPLYDGSRFANGVLRVYNGFPYKVRDGAVRLTTYDVPAFGYDNVDETKYINEVWNIKRIVTVDLTEFGKVSVKRGTADDIKAFDEFGPDCSRIVNVSRSATIDGMVVINGYYNQ